MLVTCAKCGKEKSVSANVCPHCGHETKVKDWGTRPCRACGTPLSAEAHRYLVRRSHSSIYQGSTVTRTSNVTTHVSCPKCGEPRPLLRLGDAGLGKALFAILMILTVVAA